MSSSLTQSQTTNLTTPSAKLDDIPKVTPPFEGKASVRTAVSRRGGRYGAASPGRFVYTRPPPPPPPEQPTAPAVKPEERESKEAESFQKKAAKKDEQRRNVTFSPPPPKREEAEKFKKGPRTPNHQSLPFFEMGSPTFLSPKTRIGTPTDFSVDFGKSPMPAPGLEASNVLAWLQSPTNNNLFSPGGLGSIGGTPSRGGPRTPISSSSFFFSDVASLPRPKRMTSMISISPLSAAKRPRYDDSPQPLPEGDESPVPSAARERMQMQDEDLSVLLQLASHSNTPSRNGHNKRGDYRDDNSNPSLQLPMIGSTDREGSGPKLLRKKGTEGYLSAFRYSEKENEEEKKTDALHAPQDPAFSYPAMPPGGSMSVVVGGPPPMSSKPKKVGAPGRSTSFSGEGYPYPPRYYPYPPPSQAAAAAAATAAALKPAPSARIPAAAAKTATTTSKKPKATPGLKPVQKPAPKVAPKPAPKRGSPTSTKRTRKMSPLPKKKAAEKKPSAVANGSKNDKAAELAAAILRGVTMRPSGKWQAQLYYAGKSRYIGVFDSREKAALAYEIAREKLKSTGKASSGQSAKATEDAVNSARKAAFDGVNEKF